MSTFVYIACFMAGEREGIRSFRWDASSGSLEPIGTSPTGNPLHLATDPQQRFLYAANCVFACAGKLGGGVSAWAIDPDTGALRLLNEQNSGGTIPVYVSLSKRGRFVFVANCGSPEWGNFPRWDGTAAALPVQSDGSLGEISRLLEHEGSSVNPDHQGWPHPHSFVVAPDGRYAFVPDRGIDKVMSYRFDEETGSLPPNDPEFAPVAPGSGPRHFVFHPNGRVAYLINELGCTMIAYAYDAATGTLSELQTVSTLPDGVTKPEPVGRGSPDGWSTAEVQVHPSGRFLYGSNRGHDSIVGYSIDAQSGKLTLIDHTSTQGKCPRGFALDPTGDFLVAANEFTNTVVTCRIDQEAGKLTATGHVAEMPKPACVKFVQPRA